eukprot:TRINITY_DN665_c0_g1_i1.p1 TRINITY_DN665_c0_g1~~TRINITY_DN665_c0_g1_i1.p1  ORF type:complete len:777 (+),score=151.66 TRINITY_DN665_c0_g1_i1:82-2412(+)
MPPKKRTGADLKRPKAKLGKKIASVTATNIDVRSRVLNIQQTVTADKGDDVTARNLTLKDLLGQLHHYSENVRKAAYQGLQELLLSRPAVLAAHAGTVIIQGASGLTDESGAVRKAVRSLMASLAEAITEGALLAYMPSLSAHICAAMTHTQRVVRNDTAETVAAIARHRPKAIGSSAQLFMPSFAAMLSNTQTLVTAERRILMASLLSFVTAVYPPPTTVIGTEISHTLELEWSENQIVSAASFLPFPQQAEQSADDSELVLQAACDMLQPLCTQWIDCANGTDLESMRGIAGSLAILLPRLSSDVLQSSAVQCVITSVLPHFPVGVGSGDAGSASLHEINAALCRVAVLLADVAPDAVLRAAAYTAETLATSAASSLMSVVLPLMQCAAVQQHHQALLEALTELQGRSRPLAHVTKDCVLVMSELVKRRLVSKAITHRWLQAFPKLLWKLKGQAPELSALVIQSLLDAVRHGDCPASLQLPQATAPSFATTVAKGDRQLLVFGPFIQLSELLQRKFASLLYYLPEIPAPLLRGIAACCNSLLLRENVIGFVLDTLFARVVAGSLPASDLVSLIMTILAGDSAAAVTAASLKETSTSAAGMSSESLARRDVLMAACACLRRVDLQSSLLDALSEHLLAFSQDGEPTKAVASLAAISALGGHLSAEVMPSLCVVLFSVLSSESAFNRFAVSALEQHPELLGALLNFIASKPSHDMQPTLQCVRSVAGAKSLRSHLISERLAVGQCMERVLQTCSSNLSARGAAELVVAEVQLLLGA